MAEKELTTKTEVVLKGEIARIPLSLRGVLQGGGVAEVSGRVTIEKTLRSLLGGLSKDFNKAVDELDKRFGVRLPDVTLESLAFGYNLPQKFAQLALTMTAGESRCHFVVLKKKSEKAEGETGESGGIIVGLELQSDAPILRNNLLSGLIGEISIDSLGVYYAGADFPAIKFFPAQAFQDADTLALVEGTAVRKFSKGFNFSAGIRVGDLKLLDLLGADTVETNDPGTAESSGREAPPEKSSTSWIKTDKKIGPLSVKRIGLSFEAPRIGIKLDAGLQLSCLAFMLEGLGMSYPIDKFTTDPAKIWEHLRFHLDGASVSFERGPLTISGGMLKIKDEPLELLGTLFIRTPICTVAAVGSYTTIAGAPSFFAFAVLQKEIGGPPLFFVTGLAFGFGVNRALKLPSINEVQNFPLLKAATDPNYLGKTPNLREIGEKLEDYISPCKGNFWIAAGVKFTSFGQIESFALLSVSFGTQFEIALLGLSKLQIPKPPASGATTRPLACIEMAIRISFTPECGLLACEARLTENSYFLMKEFRLRGGFAFYSWFSGDHEGDFVVSVGGYHPKFKLPAHYPKPDLVEFSCTIGSVAISGHCYFALCPSAIMAGGGLSIVYQSGGIRAWFVAYADFLIQWKPLYYDIAIGVGIGVVLHLKVGFIRVNLSVELSAAVRLYGPPLGGTARISLWIVSFSVAFGADRRVPPPLVWESADPEKSFAASFLPNPDVTRISIVDGLLHEVKDGDKTNRFVNPHKLVLSCRTQVPVTAANVNMKEYRRKIDKSDAEEKYEIPQPTVGGRPKTPVVRPMGDRPFTSLLKITLAPDGGASDKARAYLDQYLEVAPVTKSLPLALWGENPAKDGPPGEQMIDNVLVGFEIRTRPGPRPWELPALDLAVLAYDRRRKEFYLGPLKPAESLEASERNTIADTIASPDIVKKRRGILEELSRTGRRIMKPDEIRLDQLAKNAESIFQDMPAMAVVGQVPPRSFPEI